jgi:hypothetical protein
MSENWWIFGAKTIEKRGIFHFLHFPIFKKRFHKRSDGKIEEWKMDTISFFDVFKSLVT